MDKSIRLFPDAIARRRAQNNGLDFLSDWQVQSAHITAGAIGSLASGCETGPIYVPMPTGSGKTTGAIWGIVDFVRNYPEQRLCFLTPYTSSVDHVYAELVRQLGDDCVGHYHSDAVVNKEVELGKQVVVLTHQFVAHNNGRLDDRDLFVVDEAIYATGEASLKLHHFAEARAWATRNNVFAEPFTKLTDFAYELDQKLRGSENKYVAAPPLIDRMWAEEIATELNLDDYSQTTDNMEALKSAQRFCEALLEGLVFLTRGNIDKGKYDPVYSAAVLGIPRMDKTVILSATGGMVYDIAGPFKQDKGSQSYWTPPSYQNLKLIKLTAPQFYGQYKQWKRHSSQVEAYVDWLLSEIKEQSIYLTLPKAVIDSCLRGYLGQPKKGDLVYPLTISKHGKQVFISNHARSVGSNEFKDCEAVVYLWENHLPQSVAVQRFHTLASQAITSKALENANGGKLVGNYQRIRDAQIIDNMMQQIGRGRVRRIDEQAMAGSMSAYVLCSAVNFERLANQYRDCKTTELEFEGIQADLPTGRVARVLHYLRNRHPKEDVPFKEVEKAVGFHLRSCKVELEADWDLRAIGFQYVSGQKGRGKAGHFRWIEK